MVFYGGRLHDCIPWLARRPSLAVHVHSCAFKFRVPTPSPVVRRFPCPDGRRARPSRVTRLMHSWEKSSLCTDRTLGGKTLRFHRHQGWSLRARSATLRLPRRPWTLTSRLERHRVILTHAWLNWTLLMYYVLWLEKTSTLDYSSSRPLMHPWCKTLL